MKKRLVFGAGTVLLVSLASTSHAQIAVTDVLAFVKHVALVLLQIETQAVRQDQAERVYKMSLRLSTWTSLLKYAIDREDQPEWRIHCWFEGCGNLYANDYLHALTYGDADGAGYDHVTTPRQPAGGILDGLSDEAAASVRADLALIDLADSAIIRGTHETGRIRFASRDEAEAIIALDAIVTDDTVDDSLAASLDRVTAASMLEAQNKQTRAELEAATLEQLLVEQAWDRSGETAITNMRIRKLQADQGGEDRLPSMVDRATDALVGWRLP